MPVEETNEPIFLGVFMRVSDEFQVEVMWK